MSYSSSIPPTPGEPFPTTHHTPASPANRLISENSRASCAKLQSFTQRLIDIDERYDSSVDERD
jgi:hypothetical protein